MNHHNALQLRVLRAIIEHIYKKEDREDMEQINKLLILLAGLAIGAIIYIVISNNNVVKTMMSNMEAMMENKNISLASHPYNECIKLLIDQVNKENKESDFEKMKTVCFVLAGKNTNNAILKNTE